MLQTLLDHLPVGVALFDRDLRLAASNRRAADMLDFPAERFRAGMAFDEMVRVGAERGDYGAGVVHDQVRVRVERARRAEPCRDEHVLPNGRIVEVNGVPLAEGGFLTVFSDVTEQRRAGRLMMQSEARLRDFAQASADWAWEQDSDLRFSWLSPGTEATSGLAASALLGRKLEEVEPLAIIDAADRQHHAATLAARKPFRDVRIEYRDGEQRTRHLAMSGKPVFDPAGRFAGYRGTAIDITVKVEAEAQAELARARLAEAIESLSDAFALFDADDRLVLSNRAYSVLLGPTGRPLEPGMTFTQVLQETIESGVLNLDPGATEAWIAWRMARHQTPAGPIEWKMRGSQWIQIREQRMPNGDTILIASDISALKEREQEIADKTALLQTTLERMGEGISVVDAEMRLVAWNDRYIEILDLPRSLVQVGTRLRDVARWQVSQGEFGPGDPDEILKVRATRFLGPEPVHYRRTRPNGRMIEVVRNRMPSGGLVSIYKDITEQEQAERALRRAKEAAEVAARTKTEFLANMSHELRTPLNAILGFSEILRRQMFGPLGSPRYQEYAADIFDSGSHLLSLINDILDISKAEAGKVQIFDEIFPLAKVVAESVRLVQARAEEAGLEFAISPLEGLPLVRAEERRLKQILLNLLSNAIKFTPTGGKVRLEVACDRTRGIWLRVHDTGIGISAEDIPKALTPFGQIDSALSRKFPGTGLGLSLTKEMVELHGGTLDIDSVAGQGTAVTVTLPADRIVERIDVVASGDEPALTARPP